MILKKLVLVSALVLSSFALASEPADIVVIFDTSSSMNDNILDENGHVGSKINYAKKKTSEILDLFAKEDKYNLKLIHFLDGNPILNEIGLLNSENFRSEVLPAIKNYSGNGGTPLANSIDLATNLFLSSDSKQQALIILSDGQDNDGPDALIRSMNNLEQKTGGNVMVQFFALGVNAQTWREFQNISRTIRLGTLFLVENGSVGGDFFSLTYDAISGNWGGPQLRQNVGKRLGHIHANHVHVISALDRAADRDRIDRMTTLDWNLLKDEDPDLYRELKSWFLNLERQFQRAYAKDILNYLLNDVIRPQINPEDSRVTNLEAYKRAVKHVWETGADTHRDLFEESKQKFQEIPHLFRDGQYHSVPLVSSLVALNGIGGAIVASSHYGSGSTSVMDLTTGYLSLEAQRLLSMGPYSAGNTELGSSLGTTMGFLFLSALVGDPESKLYRKYPGVVSLLGSSASVQVMGSSSALIETPDSNPLTTDYLLAIKGEMASRRAWVQEREYKNYQEMIQREEAMATLRAMFPYLDDEAILERIETASKTTNILERAKVLFAGNPEIMTRVAIAEVLSEEIEANGALNAMIQDWAKKNKDLKGLRTGKELPTSVQAYLFNLANTIENQQFTDDVLLFLKGAKR